VSRPPDFNRIAELNKRLDEICREAEEIRTRIVSTRKDPPPWPNRKPERSATEEEESASPPGKPEPV
jgi:hypothetical protein